MLTADEKAVRVQTDERRPPGPLTVEPPPPLGPRLPAVPALTVLALVAVFVWSYWTTLATFASIWSSNPQYSHGYLVPAFAALLLWARRGRLRPELLRPNLLGVFVLVLGLALWLAGAYFYLAWPERISVLPVVFGACLALGGWPCVRWAWPSIAFLVFMIPLPGRLETLLAGPLQRVATLLSTNVLQTLGFFAYAEGNVIVLSEGELGIVEACSGLRMFFSFLALSVALAAVSSRPLWQRGLLVASAVPVAIVCNVARISLTGALYETAGRDTAQMVFHDLAGWLMMPLALALLGLELVILSRLFVVPPAEVPALTAMGRCRPRPAVRSGPDRAAARAP